MVVLEGQQVLPKRTLTTGFKYQYPKVKQALEEILLKGVNLSAVNSNA